MEVGKIKVEKRGKVNGGEKGKVKGGEKGEGLKVVEKKGLGWRWGRLRIEKRRKG